MPYGAAALAIGLVIVLLGATVQGLTGVGVSMLSSPVLAVAAPKSMPATIVLVALPMCVLSLLRERQHLDRQSLPWLFMGVIPGTLVGLGIVVALRDKQMLTLLIGVITLVGVALSHQRVRVPISPTTAFVAAFIANVFGTAGGSSGAPIALLFQRERGARSRATLAAFFAVSAATSIIGYAVTSELHRADIIFALLLLPAVIAGLCISGPLRKHVDKGRFRHLVLSVTAAAGAIAVLRGLL